jgi:hypothetical protein
LSCESNEEFGGVQNKPHAENTLLTLAILIIDVEECQVIAIRHGQQLLGSICFSSLVVRPDPHVWYCCNRYQRERAVTFGAGKTNWTSWL